VALTNRARMSTSCNWIPAFPVGVRPTGSLTTLSRQAAGWMYAGVLLETPTSVDVEGQRVYERLRRDTRPDRYHGDLKDFSF